MVNRNKKSGYSTSSASEKNAEWGKAGGRRTVGKEIELRYEKIQGIESTNAGCREPNVAVVFVKSVESSSESESPGGNGARAA